VRVTSTLHPLCGEQLDATGFKRWKGKLMLVVVLPDGSPGTIPADATDVLGHQPAGLATSGLTVEGVQRLRALVMVLGAPRTSTARPKTRK